MPPKRMTANPIKPARYRPGKPIAEDGSSSDEASDAEEAQEQQRQQPKIPPPKATSFPADAKKNLTNNLKNVDLEARRKQAEVQERQRLEHERRERAEKAKMEREAGFVTESEDEDEDGDDGVEDEDEVDQDAVVLAPSARKPPGPRPRAAAASDDEESDSDEEDGEDESSDDEPAPKLLRPVFLKKSQRDATASTIASNIPDPAEQAALDAARRQAEADALIQEKLERDAAARAAGKASWDDDAPEVMGAVDDTDGLDPELERAQWVARELARLKRARAALEEREKEIEEVERRRNMDVGEREEEDRKFVEEQKQEKMGREKAGFMARYHHRGAFFLEEGKKAGEGEDGMTGEQLAQRNLMGAKYANREGMTEAMPEYLQVRDVTKIGRKGRTKYKDMRSEDTGRWGDFGRDFGKGVGYERRGGQGQGDGRRLDDGDERFRSDGPMRPTGANAGVLGERERERDRDRDRERKRPYGEDRRDEPKRAKVGE